MMGSEEEKSHGTADSSTLYRIDIQYLASPEEVHTFTDLLEDEGYEVVTDLSAGKLEVRQGDDE